MSIAAAHAARTAKSRALFARLVEVSKTARTAREQAEALGVPVANVKFIRYHARKAGFNLDDETSSRLEAITREMRGPRCPRDGLRGPHLCVDVRVVSGFGAAAFGDLGATALADVVCDWSSPEGGSE